MANLNKYKKQSGFTLIELLVVIGILAVLLTIVLIAINPKRQFGQANDTKRRSDVVAILNAVGAYSADNAGALPAAITTSAQDATVVCSSIITKYIASIPVDPSVNSGTALTTCDGSNTGYTIQKDSNGRVTVSATPEVATSISVTR